MLQIAVPFKVTNEGEFYEKYTWTCELYLRNKLIQFQNFVVQIAATFAEDTTSDVLLVLHQNTSRDTFLNWMNLFSHLFLTVNFWDTEYNYGRFSIVTSYHFIGFEKTKNDKSWLNTCNMIVYPASNDVALDLIKSDEVFKHLHVGIETKDDRSLILFGAHGMELFPYFKQHTTPIQLSEQVIYGYHMFYPSIQYIKAKVQEARVKHVLPDKYAWMDCKIKVQRTGLFSWSYGSVVVYECKLPRDTKFYASNMYQEFSQLAASQNRNLLRVAEATVIVSLIRGMQVSKKLQLVSSEACYSVIHAKTSLGAIAAFALILDLQQELRSTVRNSFSNLLLDQLRSAKQYDANPCLRTTTGATLCNLTMIAALQHFAKFIKSSFKIYFAANKT